MCKPRLPFKHDRGLRRDTAKLRIWGSGVRISLGAPTKSGTYRIAVCPENWPGQTRGRSENDLVAATLVRVFAWAAPRGSRHHVNTSERLRLRSCAGLSKEKGLGYGFATPR